ncbi:MAG: class I SAM-dependent methyltransferase [Candidatus Nealsonbacteria bacterium]|nr:class I SAM-dependent methyltransferase [Candidatus Nealsonbacteria bacterium]
MKDNIIYNFKNLLKEHVFLFKTARWLFGALKVGLGPEEAIKGISGKIVNLGSGTQRIRKDVINMDIHAYHNVDIVGDIYNLPFAENEADAVICDQVLEHLNNPDRALLEMARALKPGGLIYIAVPFVAGYHSSPDDYYRFTKNGLEATMESAGFLKLKSGIRHGPTSGFLSVFNQWLAMIFCFGSDKTYQLWLIIFTALTFPLKFLDYLFYRYGPAENIAFSFYYLGKKK